MDCPMTYRLSLTNIEFIQSEADKMGVSQNSALNVLLNELRARRQQLAEGRG